MMATMSIEELYSKYVKHLPVEDRIKLVEVMNKDIAESVHEDDRPKWSDIRGTAPYPLEGEDAQEWVTRTRRESDEAREIKR